MSARTQGRRTWLLRQIARRIWFRAAAISLASIALAVAIGVLAPRLPYELSGDVGQDSVGTILSIMASSMLAVTTFSLTAMVSAYGAATQLATPRATQLMLSDPTSQNALSSFLGAFVFSIVGIIGLESDSYGQDGRTVLFGATVLVIALVVVTLLRWIGHIAAFGRMADVIDRVEDAAAQAMAAFAADPWLGGRAAVVIPHDAGVLMSTTTGYVAHIDVTALARVARASGLTVHVTAMPGTLVHPARALARIAGPVDEEARGALVAAFVIERHRSFDQDPRLGLIALSEIASRALAPATNDPGTAIEVLNALLRVFLELRAQAPTIDPDGLPPVHVDAPTATDMLVDAFRPIVRDGAVEVEVTIRLSATLAALHAALPQLRAPLEALVPGWLARATRTLADPDDRVAFAAAAAEHWPRPG